MKANLVSHTGTRMVANIPDMRAFPLVLELVEGGEYQKVTRLFLNHSGQLKDDYREHKPVTILSVDTPTLSVEETTDG